MRSRTPAQLVVNGYQLAAGAVFRLRFMYDCPCCGTVLRRISSVITNNRLSLLDSRESFVDLRDKFKIAVLQGNAAQFEGLFSKVKNYTHADFAQVKPHGNIGDRGNDGWLPSSGTYYQVYAPEELSTNTATAQQKVKDDFKKLKLYWETIRPIRNFYFVLNDKFVGVSPHIWRTLSEIQSAESLENAGVYDTASLERDLFSLQHDEICSVLGVSPIDSGHIAEDKRKVREFLDYFSLAFTELFPMGGEAGYFFPANVLYEYGDSLGNDWHFQRLKSNDPSIAQHQTAIRELLQAMFRQLRNDSYYDDIGRSLKYKPPFDLKGRDQLIEERKASMGKFIAQMEFAYDSIKGYAA